LDAIQGRHRTVIGSYQYCHAEKHHPIYLPTVGHPCFNRCVYSFCFTFNLHLTMKEKIKNDLLTVCEVKISYQSKVKPCERPKIISSADTYRLFVESQIFSPETIEHREFFKVMFLNNAGKLLGIMHVSEGTTDSTIVDVKHVMQGAILAHAKNLILCHNHPSGNCIPSALDDTITQKIKQACALFSMTVLDHLIITPYAYYSYADEGRI
jgi:DNA repair protein RadC